MRKYVVVVALAFSAMGVVQAAPTIRTIPSSAALSVGEVFTVQLEISGLGDFVAPSLGVYDLDVSYDPGIVSPGSVSFGTGLDVLGLGSIQSVSLGTAAVNLFELSLDSVDDLNSLQLDAFVLATINFVAIGNGGSNFELALNAIGDAEGRSLDVNAESGRVEVTETQPPSDVPEPASLALVASGIGLAAWVTRRPRRLGAAHLSAQTTTC